MENQASCFNLVVNRVQMGWRRMRTKTFSVADEAVYRSAMALLGASLGACATVAVAALWVHVTENAAVSVQWGLILKSGALAGAVVAVLMPEWIILGVQVFGAEPPVLTLRWFGGAVLFGAVYVATYAFL